MARTSSAEIRDAWIYKTLRQWFKLNNIYEQLYGKQGKFTINGEEVEITTDEKTRIYAHGTRILTIVNTDGVYTCEIHQPKICSKVFNLRRADVYHRKTV